MKKALDSLVKTVGAVKFSSKDTPSRHDKCLSGQNKKLKKLLKKITKNNIHPEVDWGPSVGKEIF